MPRPRKTTASIRTAIAGRRVVVFWYAGRRRVCEPHVLGVTNGSVQLLCWQLEGGTNSKIPPRWRRFDVDSIARLRITTRVFPGARPVRYPYSKWDQVIVTV